MSDETLYRCALGVLTLMCLAYFGIVAWFVARLVGSLT